VQYLLSIGKSRFIFRIEEPFDPSLGSVVLENILIVSFYLLGGVCLRSSLKWNIYSMGNYWPSFGTSLIVRDLMVEVSSVFSFDVNSSISKLN